jgi:alanine dehydrogenase
MTTSNALYADIVGRLGRTQGAKATFLLGTDFHIGEEHLPPGGVVTPEEDPRERRVGITPGHVSSMSSWLQAAGVAPRLYVVAGAGARAGFPDAAYEDAGATVVPEAKVASLEHAPDVVHALKEPTAYEATIPGRCIRIGALHLGDFHAESGLAAMMKKGNFSGVIDGSYMGGYAYKLRGGFDVPLRKTMSDFAGDIGADEFAGGAITRDPKHRHKVVVVGGGVAGRAAARRIVRTYGDTVSEVSIVEAMPGTRDALEREFGGDARVRVVPGSKVGERELDGVTALIVATFRDSAKDFVTSLGALKAMRRSGVIVDISCDEGPSVEVAGVEKYDGEAARAFVRSAVEGLGTGLRYEADTHLPRKRPHQASEAHGREVFPYLATLMHLCAACGGSAAAVEYLAAHTPGTDAGVFGALVSDLRAGLVITGPRPVIFRIGLEARTERTITAFGAAHQLPIEWRR